MIGHGGNTALYKISGGRWGHDTDKYTGGARDQQMERLSRQMIREYLSRTFNDLHFPTRPDLISQIWVSRLTSGPDLRK